MKRKKKKKLLIHIKLAARVKYSGYKTQQLLEKLMSREKVEDIKIFAVGTQM